MAWLMAWAAPAAAADKAVATGEKTPSLDAALGGPRWKWTSQELMGHIERRLWDDYKSAKKALPGPLEIDRLRERTLKLVVDMKAHFVRFEKGSQDYRVSIVDQDFKRGTDEAMLPWNTPEGQQYWFFVQDQLWKLVLAYNADQVQGQAVKDFAKTLRGAFGKPVDLVFDDEGGGEDLVAVKWADEDTQVELRDRRDPYGTFTLSLTCRSIEGRIAELRGETAGLGVAGGGGANDALIDDIMTDAGADGGGNVVDELLGGTPAIGVPSGGTPAHPERKGRDDGAPTTPSDDAPAEGDDPPIIY